jgi:hypothetical protein
MKTSTDGILTTHTGSLPRPKTLIDIIIGREEGRPIVRLFKWYATGTLSLKEAAQKARAAGLAYRKSGRPCR